MSCMLPHKLLLLTSDGDADDNNNNNGGNNKKKINTNISYQNYNQELNEELDDNNEKSIDSNDDKAFDDVVFDILKVDPEEIASQLTLIDLPLFKKIQPEELISCKWMSRDKQVKAPNIVAFIKRFNQTTFWIQKEILVCKRLEKRAKMITHFIKITKRLNEMQNYNSVMAIISGLKSAPIERLKKTWNLISKRDLNFFERIWHVMYDTSDNQRKLRALHNHCKLPVIPFLGLYLTDLIHIDIAHPHNCFDNPQRRNQMNNICRVLSDYQQSTYERLIEISYVKNYLNSFVYFEEFQTFKENENYRDSLELEPDTNTNSNSNNNNNDHVTSSSNNSPSLTPVNRCTSTPINEKYINMNIEKIITDDENKKTTLNRSLTVNNNNDASSQIIKYNNNNTSSGKHKKTLSLNFNKDVVDSCSKNSHSFTHGSDQTSAVKHPLDDSIIEDPTNNDNYMKIQDTSLLKDILLKNRNKLLETDNIDSGGGGCGGNNNKSGRNLSFELKNSIEDDFCTYDIKLNNTLVSDNNASSSVIYNNNNTNHDKLKRTYEEKLLTQLNLEQKRYIIDYQTASTLCYFESTVKRKCIMKNSQKPHFSQWHSYWLQLVGNVLVYYSSKINLLPSTLLSSSSTSTQLNNNNNTATNNTNLTSSCNSVNSDSIVCNEQYYINQQSERKNYHKDPCKMHPIANWMVVALFQDDCSLLSANNPNHHHHHPHPHNSSNSNSSNCSNTSRESSNHSTNASSSLRTTCISGQKKRFDIQLNDLNNGTMYKYRFNNYKLAKEWYAHLKLAINLHERLKPENLIKFD